MGKPFRSCTVNGAEKVLSRLTELFNILKVGAGEGWGEGEIKN